MGTGTRRLGGKAKNDPVAPGWGEEERVGGGCGNQEVEEAVCREGTLRNSVWGLVSPLPPPGSSQAEEAGAGASARAAASRAVSLAAATPVS